MKISKFYLIIALFAIVNCSFAQIKKNASTKMSIANVAEKGKEEKLNPCCPPWNAKILESFMKYKGSGGIADPYTLKFVPTQAFLNQMQLYLNYINSVNPCDTSLTIDFRLHDQGLVSAPNPTAWGTQIGATEFVTWNVNTTGIGSPTGANGVFFPGFNMQAGRWYAIPTGIYTNCKNSYFSMKECNPNGNHRMYIRLQVISNKTSNLTNQDVVGFEISDGKTITTIQIEKEK